MPRYQVDQEHHHHQQQQGDEEHHPPTHLPAPAPGNGRSVQSLGSIRWQGQFANADWAQEYVRALRAGASRRAAAQFVRVKLEWMQERLEADPGLAAAADEAEAALERDLAGAVVRAALEDGDWRAGIEVLKRRRRADWGDVTQVQVLTTLTQRLQSMTDEEFAALAAQVASRALPAEHDTAIDVDSIEVQDLERND